MRFFSYPFTFLFTLPGAFLVVSVFTAAAAAGAADTTIRHYFETLSSGYSLPVHGDYLVNTKELQRVYRDRNHAPVWYKDGTRIKSARQLYLAVETAGRHGLLPEDYHNRALQTACAHEKAEDPGYCDLLLSDAFLLLAQHLQAGKVDPASFSAGWAVEKRRTNLVPLLRKAVAEGNVKDVLKSASPRPLEYERLMAALQRLRMATRYPEWNELALTPAIEPGAQDERLNAIISRLAFWGDMQAPPAPITTYDETVVQAVRHFQERHGLAGDGVINEATLTRLNITPTERAKQIIANLERLRWLEEDLRPTHMLVELAEMRLEGVKDNQTAFSMPIAICRNYRDVRPFSTRLHYMVLNPGWTVPEKLLQDGKLSILENPAQLADAGFAVFSGEELVAPGNVDWRLEDVDYRLVQAPGPLNAMGRIKFTLASDLGIYLHDAPSEGPLVESGENFTAGSIRVAEPMNLAMWLLQGTVWKETDIKAILETPEEQAVYLAEPMPVHVQYRTAWVDTQGVLNFRDDIFERDQPLYETLMQPLLPTE